MKACNASLSQTDLSNLRRALRAFAGRLRRQLPALDREELVQVGTAHALTLCDRYDPARGAAFTTFVYPYAKSGILAFVKQTGGPVLEPCEGDEVQPSYEEQVLEAETTVETSRLVRRAMSDFDPRDKALLLRVDGANECLVEVARSLGLGYKVAHYRKKKARAVLEKRLTLALERQPRARSERPCRVRSEREAGP